MDDKNTFNILCKGDTKGIFQLRSIARGILEMLEPKTLQEIIALIALYRPGPIEFIDEYIKRKQGTAPIICIHPIIDEILNETYGIILYQEQIMQIVVEVAGFSLPQSDIFRKELFKIESKIQEMYKFSFIKGAAEKKGIPTLKAEKIYDNLAIFAGYSFMKAHAVSCAIIAYQTAYLKANYPIEFNEAIKCYDKAIVKNPKNVEE